MAGCLLRWSVTYTSPRGLRSSAIRIWNRRAFQERKPYQFPGRMKNSPYYCPGRGSNPRPRLHYKQGVPHPTCSATGRPLTYTYCGVRSMIKYARKSIDRERDMCFIMQLSLAVIFSRQQADHLRGKCWSRGTIYL